MLGLDGGGWVTALTAYLKTHIEYAATVCFLLGFAESIALVSLFVPSTILFLGIGAAYAAAGGTFWPLWLAGAAGACAGDIVSYAVGRIFKDDVEKVWPFTRMPGLVPKGQVMFERWGALSIIAGKFVGGLRPFIPVVAGMMRMPPVTFVVASGVSSLIWAGVFLAPGFGISLAW